VRILVTGGAGFIASHISDAFLKAGHEVLVVDNLSTGNRANLPSAARFAEVDIASPEIREVVREFQPEIVDHHAAHADVRQSVADPAYDARVNVLGTIGLIAASVEAGVRKFVFASSGGAIYGDPDMVPNDEQHPARPISPYAASKAAGEVYLEMFSRVHGLDYTILRYPNIYGPRQHPYTEEGQVVALFGRMMLEGRQPTIFGDGKQQRDFLYVGDVVDANLRALEAGSGGTFNLGHGVGVSVTQLAEALRPLTGYTGEIGYAPARPGEVYRIALDASRAREGLGWTPRTSLEEGLRQTVEWLRSTMPAEPAR
jgi:UDP-glucose 4-epimerase